MPLDLAILKFINVSIANPAFDLFFGYIGNFKIWTAPLLVIAFLLLWKGRLKGRWLVALSIITVIVVDSSLHLIFKPLFSRLRPCHAEPAITWLRTIDGCGGRYGFPSSHAANTFGQAIVIGTFYKGSRIYLFILAALISVSRVYLGLHYPLDVLAGAFYGVLLGGLVLYLAKTIAPNKIGIFYNNKIPKNSD
jgi:undecaprenyl-diphosphatase